MTNDLTGKDFATSIADSVESFLLSVRAIGADGDVKATVKLIEPTGSETHVLVDVEGQELTWIVRDRVDLEPGQSVHLSFKTKNVHFFDLKTEQRLEA